MYYQHGVAKSVSFVGKSKGRVPRYSASQFLLQQRKLKTPQLYRVTFVVFTAVLKESWRQAKIH